MIGYGHAVDSLINKVSRMALKSSDFGDKAGCDIFQDGSVGANSSIAESLPDHISALRELLSWLVHEDIETAPTHPIHASLRGTRAAQGGISTHRSSVIVESGRLLYVAPRLVRRSFAALNELRTTTWSPRT